jgi:hypothetical protein
VLLKPEAIDQIQQQGNRQWNRPIDNFTRRRCDSPANDGDSNKDTLGNFQTVS